MPKKFLWFSLVDGPVRFKIGSTTHAGRDAGLQAHREDPREFEACPWTLDALYSAARLTKKRDAEDLVQDTFLRAFPLLRTSSSAATNMKAWFFKILTNTFIKQVTAAGEGAHGGGSAAREAGNERFVPASRTRARPDPSSTFFDKLLWTT